MHDCLDDLNPAVLALQPSCAVAPRGVHNPADARLDRPAPIVNSTQAEKLSREGDYRGAAQAYEALAAESPGELRDRFLLRAARERVRAATDERSERAPRPDQHDACPAPISRCARRSSRSWRCRRIARTRRSPKLDRIPQPLPRDAAADVLELRARALFALNRPAAGVNVALERERSLTNPADVRANQRLIWTGLQKSAASNADFTPPPGAGPTLTGWLELGQAALIAARNPFTATKISRSGAAAIRRIRPMRCSPKTCCRSSASDWTIPRRSRSCCRCRADSRRPA